jgi:cyanate permease
MVWLPFLLLLAPRDQPRAVDAAKAATQSVNWGELLRSRALWTMSACIFLASYFWYFLLTWVPSYLILARGFSTVEMGKILSTPLFVMAGLNIAAGALADTLANRFGVFRIRLLFAAGGYIGSAVMLLLLIVPDRDMVFPILLVAVCATGIGNSNYWSLAQHAPPAQMVGRTIGYLNTLSQVAGAAAPLITGLILGPEKHFGPAILIAGVCPVLAAGCLLFAGSKSLDQVRPMLEGAAAASPELS